MAPTIVLEKELRNLSALLRDEQFAGSITVNGMYDNNPPNDNETVKRAYPDEKVATSIAPFYALLAGFDYFAINETEPGFIFFLEAFLEDRLPASTVLLLNRLANCTWKAGQPFRDIKRIHRDNFVSAALLPEAEVLKDYQQLKAAAEKLYNRLQPLKNLPVAQQLQQLDTWLKNEAFAVEMATHIEAAYYRNLQQDPPAFIADKTGIQWIEKNTTELNLARRLGPFYALECGVSYFASAQQTLPSVMLQALRDNDAGPGIQTVFMLFAHAAWQAGYVFDGLSNINRNNFTLYRLVSDDRRAGYWANTRLLANQLQKYF